jgi:hypothetical protein
MAKAWQYLYTEAVLQHFPPVCSLTKIHVHTNTIVETLHLHLYLNYETHVIVAVVLYNYYWLTIYLLY